MTKDERFLIELYRAIKQMDPTLNATIDPMQIAKKHGFKDLLTKDILKGLRQGNLVKIYGPQEVAITERGIDVARSLLKESNRPLA